MSPPASSVAVFMLLCTLIATGATRMAAAAGADEALQTLMQQLAARKHAHATFVERRTLAVLSRPVESSGELIYDAPDRLEKRMLKPKAETLKLENGRLIAQRGQRSYSMALSDAPQLAPFIDSIRATLAGDLPALRSDYALEFHAAADGWTLQMVPHDARLQRTIRLVRIEGTGAVLHAVTIDEADGDRSVMTIRELPEP